MKFKTSFTLQEKLLLQRILDLIVESESHQMVNPSVYDVRFKFNVPELIYLKTIQNKIERAQCSNPEQFSQTQ